MQKKYSVNVKIAVLIAAWMTMASDMIVTPILGNVAKSFPNASVALTTMVYNIAGFAFIFASLLTPILCRKFTKRTLMLVGAVVSIITGGLGGCVINLPFMIVMHFIEGFGAGICTNLIPSLIVDISSNDDEIIKLNGLNGVVGTVAGFICSTLAGVIAVKYGWQAAYCLYFVGFLIFIWQVIFLPKTELEVAPEKNMKAHMTGRTWRWTVEVFVFAWLINIFWTYIAVYVDNSNIGNAGVSGVMISLITVSSFVGGFLMIPATKVLKTYAMAACAVAWIAALAIVLNSHSAVMMYIAGLVWGLGQGIAFPHMYARASLISAEFSETLTICWTTIGWYLAVGMTTIIYSPISKLFGNESADFALKFNLWGMVIYLVLVIIRGTIERKSQPELAVK